MPGDHVPQASVDPVPLRRAQFQANGAPFHVIEQGEALELARHDGLDALARLIEVRHETDARQVRVLAYVAAIKAGDLGEVDRLIAAEISVDERAPIVG